MFDISSLLAEHPPLAALAQRSGYRWFVVGTVCIGAFLGQLDASITSLVLPTLEEVFHAPVTEVEWVAIAYLLTLATLVVPVGRLADLLGRKTLYTAGFGLFILGSALCGLAPGLGWLIAFRVLQAAGAAMLQANSVAIIAMVAGRRALGRAIGMQGAAQAVGLAVGPSVGGLLIAALGWRWVFFIAVPFGLLGTILGWLVLPLTPRSALAARQHEQFDWLGAALFGGAVALGLLGLTYAHTWGWMSRRLWGVVTGAAVLLGLFVLVERRTTSPLIDFALFRHRAFSAGIVAALLAYAVLFGSLFLLPFELERVLAHGPAEAGAVLSAVPVAIGVMAPAAGIAADYLGASLPTAAGMLMAAMALVGLALVPLTSLAMLIGLLALLGAGIGLFTPANNSTIMLSAPPQRQGVAGGLLNMTRSLGTSLGVTLTGTRLALRLTAWVGHPVDRTLDVPLLALEVASQEVLLLLAALALLTALISLVRGAPARRTPGASRR